MFFDELNGVEDRRMAGTKELASDLNEGLTIAF